MLSPHEFEDGIVGPMELDSHTTLLTLTKLTFPVDAPQTFCESACKRGADIARCLATSCDPSSAGSPELRSRAGSD